MGLALKEILTIGSTDFACPPGRMSMQAYFSAIGRTLPRETRLIVDSRSAISRRMLYDLALIAEGRGHKMFPTSRDVLQDMNMLEGMPQLFTPHFCVREKSTKSRNLDILWSTSDPFSPSSLTSLQDCAQRLRSHDIDVRFVDPTDKLDRSSDALFIRMHTHPQQEAYAWALDAERCDMVTIDDTTSIIRCCSKLFTFEALVRNDLATPDFCYVATPEELGLASQKLGFPLIVKTSDGSFSRGVFKVDNALQLEELATALWSVHPILIVQKFVPTDFDWRIGILDGKPLFACKYFMADAHWQIIKRERNDLVVEGRGVTVPTRAVPHSILETAIRAAGCIGQGLYGVDIKVVDDRIYVIEVNDNPTIESDLEAAADPVWEQLAAYFAAAITGAQRDQSHITMKRSA